MYFSVSGNHRGNPAVGGSSPLRFDKLECPLTSYPDNDTTALNINDVRIDECHKVTGRNRISASRQSKTSFSKKKQVDS